MDKVDLDTAEGRRAYRDELNGVARPYRWAGLVFIVIVIAAPGGIVGLVRSRMSPAGTPR